jgi:hypothetical protein
MLEAMTAPHLGNYARTVVCDDYGACKSLRKRGGRGSKREARELLSTDAIMISARKAEADTRITADWLLFGEIALIRRSKKTWHVARFE